MRNFSCGLVLAGFAVLTLTSGQSNAGDAKQESGYTPLFNGKDLSGWKTKSGESLEGKTEAFKGRFKVKDGSLYIDPKVKGDVVIQTAKDIGGDVHIKIEFLPGKGCNNDTFFRGIKYDITPGNIKNMKLDEWNELEIIAQGKKVEYKCNGVTQKTVNAKTETSPLGLRAEFGPIQIRKIQMKQIK